MTRYEYQEDSEPAEHTQLNGSSVHVSRDLSLVGWEFKIVRASRNLFRNPAIFQQMCEEEAQAGWILLEKIDDRRVRFKRSLALRDFFKPESLYYDPYRCYYSQSSSSLIELLGASSAMRISLAIAAVLVTIIPAYFGYTVVLKILTNSRYSPPPSPPPQLSFPSK